MSRPVPTGSTIRVFLVAGRPQGLRVIDRPGWTGVCLAFSRADYPEARKRAELQRTGVYVLIGPDPDGKRSQRVYVGEGDSVITRLDSHQREKDFWTDGYVLTTSDESLDKAQVRYLESRLLDIARLADNATSDNGTAPGTPRLDEPRTADMESFLDRGLTIFPLLGVDAFDIVNDPKPTAPTITGTGGSEAGQPLQALRLTTPGTDARGREDSRGFLVLAGSTARRQAVQMSVSYNALRKQLIDEGILVPGGDDSLRLTKDYVFDSPSAAASVMAGGSKNGRTEWKDATNRTLKEIQELSVQAAGGPADAAVDPSDGVHSEGVVQEAGGVAAE